MIRVMSYNIEGHATLKRDKHIAEIASVIRQIRPDIVGLQEVHRGTTQSRGTDQAAELAAATGLDVHFGRSLEGWGGEYGNAVLTSGKIVEAVVHPLPGGGEPRTLLETKIDIRGTQLTFFVTHLTAWFRVKTKARKAQLERLAAILQDAKPPFVLVGDFNTPPEAEEMRGLLETRQLAFCGEHTEMSHAFSRKRLDYVFSDPSVTTRDSWVIRLGPSDHWPLVADLEVAAPPTE